MLVQHISQCAEQADSRELEKKGGKTFHFSLPLFYLLLLFYLLHASNMSV